jgi:glycosyltransferase involved in cell wall biosynthesis
MAASLGLGSRIRFLGLVSREELMARMQASRVLLATQGVSAVVEAVLSGRPVVAYDHECNVEFIRHEETGLLAPFRDVDALAAAVQRVLKDDSLGVRLGQRGRQAMLAECGISESIEHRRQFFRRCLQG